MIQKLNSQKKNLFEVIDGVSLLKSYTGVSWPLPYKNQLKNKEIYIHQEATYFMPTKTNIISIR